MSSVTVIAFDSNSFTEWFHNKPTIVKPIQGNQRWAITEISRMSRPRELLLEPSWLQSCSMEAAHQALLQHRQPCWQRTPSDVPLAWSSVPSRHISSTVLCAAYWHITNTYPSQSLAIFSHCSSAYDTASQLYCKSKQFSCNKTHHT